MLRGRRPRSTEARITRSLSADQPRASSWSSSSTGRQGLIRAGKQASIADRVADPGDDPLVEQRIADLAPGPRARSSAAGRRPRRRSPARERIGAELQQARGRCAPATRSPAAGAGRRSARRSRAPRPASARACRRAAGRRRRSDQRPFMPRWLWRTRSPEKWTSRCLPRASACSSVRPRSSLGAAVERRARVRRLGELDPPGRASAALIRRAARWMVSPSGTTPTATSRRGWREKPAAMSVSSRPEPITGSPSTRSIAELRDQPLAGRVGELGDRLDQRLALELDQAQDALAAALDVEDRLAVAQQDVGAGGARAPAGRPSRLALRPRQRGAVGLGRVGGGEHQVLARPRCGSAAQPLDRARRARTGRRRGPRRSSRGARCRASPGSRARRRARRSRRGRPRRARVSRVTIP